MSAVSTATALVGAQAAQTQASLATVMLKQKHQADANLVAMLQQLVDAGAQAAKSHTPPGTGEVVDVSV